MVKEEYQGLGIASITLRHLAGVAKNKGIAQFRAEVLLENRGMLAMAQRSGLPMKQESAGGVLHVKPSPGENGQVNVFSMKKIREARGQLVPPQKRGPKVWGERR